MFETGLLRGKRVLVTGGGTGLGLSMGKRFLELGASLAICGRREEVLKQATAELEQSAPGRVAWHRCDIRDAAAVDAMLDALWAEGPLDALVNNAAGNFIAKTEELSPRAIDAVLGIVLHGSAYVTLGLRPALARRAAPRQRALHRDHLCLDRLGLCGAVGDGQGRRARHDPQPGGGMGRKGRAPERDRARTVPDPRRVGAPGAAPGHGQDGSRPITRLGARAGMRSWPTSRRSCSPTVPATSMARSSPSTAANGCRAPASSTSCAN